jgi:hypothetical protein
MAEINGVKMSDEQFMLSLELGTILYKEGYDTSSGKLEPEKVKSQRGRDIMKRLAEIEEENKAKKEE